MQNHLPLTESFHSVIINYFRTLNFIRRSFAATIFFLSFHSGATQTKANEILGCYMVPSKDGSIQIYIKDGKYYGKIILNKDPSKLDVKNPDKVKQSRKILGLNILEGFKFDGDDTWESGTIYDPKNGKTYSCKITMEANGDLNVRGFVGISLFGRTAVFTKLKN